VLRQPVDELVGAGPHSDQRSNRTEHDNRNGGNNAAENSGNDCGDNDNNSCANDAPIEPGTGFIDEARGAWGR